MPTRLQSYTKTFADRLLAAIAAGTAPWQKPWRPSELVLPANLVTAHRYQGNNTILLLITAALKGYTDTRWAGFRQIADAGGKVRKGERGTPITVFRPRRTDDQDLDPAREDVAGADERRPTTFCSVYHVFNLEQTEGLEHLQPPRPATPAHNCHTAVNQIAVDAHVDIRHAGGDSAYYNSRLDFIAMPLRDQFDDATSYGDIDHDDGRATGPRTPAAERTGVRRRMAAEAEGRSRRREEGDRRRTAHRRLADEEPQGPGRRARRSLTRATLGPRGWKR